MISVELSTPSNARSGLKPKSRRGGEICQPLNHHKDNNMTVEQIKQAVRQGQTVYSLNPSYRVNLHIFKDGTEQWLIICDSNQYAIGLTSQSGVLNADPQDFYIPHPKQVNPIVCCIDIESYNSHIGNLKYWNGNEKQATALITEAFENRTIYSFKGFINAFNTDEINQNSYIAFISQYYPNELINHNDTRF